MDTLRGLALLLLLFAQPRWPALRAPAAARWRRALPRSWAALRRWRRCSAALLMSLLMTLVMSLLKSL